MTEPSNDDIPEDEMRLAERIARGNGLRYDELYVVDEFGVVEFCFLEYCDVEDLTIEQVDPSPGVVR